MPDPAFDDFNKQIMSEFHGNAGKVGGRFRAQTVLALESKPVDPRL